MTRVLQHRSAGYIWGVVASLLAVLPAAACSQESTIGASTSLEPTVILISFDGFRWDYIEMVSTPSFDRLVNSGVRARSLIPSFPTKTFPNHYTIVTGLYPEHHGIVANTMWDPVFNASYSLGNRDAVQDGRWYGGEPIWVTAENQGQISAIFFWPGSEAPIQGVRPTHWRIYDGTIPNTARIDQTLEWLRLPPEERPTFLAIYFSQPNDVAHEHGAESPEALAAVSEMDELVGQLLSGLDADGVSGDVNIILTSDHGMVDLSPDRVFLIDDYLDLSTVDIVDMGPVTALIPHDGRETEVYESLAGKSSGVTFYWKEEIPQRLHYSNHRRITPIVGIADETWTVTTRPRFEARGVRAADHGYDPAFLSQHAIFVASGPAFKSGVVVEPFENVEIYNIMAHVLGLTAAANDGDLQRVRHVLAD